MSNDKFHNHTNSRDQSFYDDDYPSSLYLRIIESSETLVTVVDHQGRIMYINPRVETLLGYNVDECTGTSAFGIVYEEDREYTRMNFRRWLKEKNEHVTFENRLISKGGTVIDILWTINLHYKNDGTISMVSSIGWDISGLKKAENSLQHHLDFEGLIIGISSSFIHLRPGDVDGMITTSIGKIADFFNADAAFIYKFRPDTNILSLSHLWPGEKVSAKGPYYPDLNSGFMKWWMKDLMQMKEIQFLSIEDLPPEAVKEREFYENIGINSMIQVPFEKGRQMDGFLGIGFENDGRNWDQEEIALLRVAGTIFTEALARRKSEEEVVKGRERYYSLFQSMNEAAAIHEVLYNKEGEMTDFIITEVNSRYEENTGMQKDQVEGKRASELFGSSPFREIYAEVDKTGKHVTFNAWFEPLKKHFKISAFSVGKGKFVTVFSDITDEVRNRERLENTLKELGELKQQLEADNLYLREEISLEHNFEEIISTSESFRIMLRDVEQVAKTRTTVLILGETGTGKELIARAIHSVSDRADRTMVKLNCAAIPESLLESELFGHEKGAFTGAVSRRAGRFELADGSTLFLDEIGDLPLSLQPKLLRVLQDGEFERLGGVTTLKTDVRIVAASNRNLEEDVDAGHFRRDLYYRLNVFPIHVPPLRERKEDIPVLVNYFADKYAQKHHKKILSVSAEAIKMLSNYDWPGNVRELENIIERSVILSTGGKLEVGNWFGEKVSRQKQKQFLTLHGMEKDYILKVLENCNWKVSGPGGAAAVLNIKPTTLEARMKKLGIHRGMRS